MLEYGNKAPVKQYILGGGGNSTLIFNPGTNTLYGRGLTGYEIGLTNDIAYNNFVKVASNVKRLLTTRCGGSRFNAYLSTDDKIYFAGNDASMRGSNTVVNVYNGWTDKTAMFLNAGIQPDNVKEIQAWYDLKMNVVTNDGNLYCAGKNNITAQTSFGTGNNNDSNYTLVKVPLSNVKTTDGNMYLTNAGELYMTGINDKYQYGDGSNVGTTGLKKIVFSGVVDIKTGYQNSYYLSTDNIMYGCGRQFNPIYGNEYGTGAGGPYTYTSYINMRTNVVKIDSCRGNMNTMCITSDNKLYSTGLNASGMFGTGNDLNTVVFTASIGDLLIADPENVQSVRTNSGTTILSAGRLFQAGIKYGSGMGYDVSYVEIPLTFIN